MLESSRIHCTPSASAPLSFPPLRRGGQGGWSWHNQLLGVQRAVFRPHGRSSDKRSRNPIMRLENKGEKPVLRSLLIPVVSEREKPFTVSEACAPTPPGPPFARGGNGRLAGAVVLSRAAKTRVSKPSVKYA